MSVRRIDRVNELLRREIAGYVFRLLGESGYDLAALTITRVVSSPDLRSARVFVSIRDHIDDRGAMLNLLVRDRKKIQQDINRNVKLKYTPHLTFKLDPAIEQGDRVLTILHELEGAGQLPVSGREDRDDE